MAERKLPSRRRRASKGEAIRVSDLVYAELDQARRLGLNKHKMRSWDAQLRRMLGLPDRQGRPQPLIEGMLEVHSGMFILRLKGATWLEVEEAAFKLADSVARRKKLNPVQPIRMRELR